MGSNNSKIIAAALKSVEKGAPIDTFVVKKLFDKYDKSQDGILQPLEKHKFYSDLFDFIWSKIGPMEKKVYYIPMYGGGMVPMEEVETRRATKEERNAFLIEVDSFMDSDNDKCLSWQEFEKGLRVVLKHYCVDEAKIGSGPIQPGQQQERPEQHSDVVQQQKLLPQAPIMQVIVMYDYAAANHQELSIRKGDTLDVYANSGAWWFCGNGATGGKGYIPSNYVAPLASGSAHHKHAYAMHLQQQ